MPSPRFKLAAALATLMLFAGAQPASAARKTEVRYVFPQTNAGDLKADWRISRTYYHSDCWTIGSSPGSYRCATGNSLLYDPCFAAAPAGSRDRVFCPLAPWRKTVVELRIDGYPDMDPLTSYGGAFQGLTLAGGMRCQFMLGASDVVDGKRVNYACPHQRYLIGEPSRRTHRWRIQAVKRGTASWIKVRKVGVRIAWRYRRG